jgi:hypothetical protein
MQSSLLNVGFKLIASLALLRTFNVKSDVCLCCAVTVCTAELGYNELGACNVIRSVVRPTSWSSGQFVTSDHEVPSSISGSTMGNFPCKGKIPMVTMVWVI